MSGYDFSQLYHSSILSYSPGTTFIATAHQNRIIIRSTSNLQIVRTWLCVPPTPLASSSKTPAEFTIDTLQWSEDGSYILAMGRGTIYVFALAQEGNGESGEVARVGEGLEGCVKAEWGKGSRDIMVWSDYGLKLTIYDLCTGLSRVVQYSKSHLHCHTYSSDGRYLAVAERHHGKEHVGVYDIGLGYQLLRHFPLETTDIQGLVWSPCGRYIAAYESSLSYSLYIHSPLGPCLTHFSPSSPSFAVGATEDPGLGIRTITWAPGGRHLAVGGWDGKVRVIENEGWRCVGLMNWGSRVGDRSVAVWKEPSDWIRDTRGRGIVQFDRSPIPAILPTVRADYTKHPLRAGISQISFNAQATLVSIRSESSPNVVHIHSFYPDSTSENPELNHIASLVFTNPIKTAKWSKGRTLRLAIATRTGAVYIWDGETGWVEDGEEVSGGMMEGIGIPARTDFSAHDLHFAPDGSSIAILDKGQFCMLYEAEGEAEQTTEERRWDMNEGLTQVNEEDEDWEMHAPHRSSRDSDEDVDSIGSRESSDQAPTLMLLRHWVGAVC